MNKPAITLDMLQNEGEKILAHGIIQNGPNDDQIYMTSTNIGRNLIWVAQKGYIDDWCIFCHWEDKGFKNAVEYGDKIMDMKNILKLVEVSKEVIKHYRH